MPQHLRYGADMGPWQPHWRLVGVRHEQEQVLPAVDAEGRDGGAAVRLSQRKHPQRWVVDRFRAH